MITLIEIILLVAFIILCIIHYISNKLTKENNKLIKENDKLHKELIQKFDISNKLIRKIYYK